MSNGYAGLTGEARRHFDKARLPSALKAWNQAHEEHPRNWWNAMEALRVQRQAQDAAAPRPERLLLFSPYYKANSYQRNLYSTAADHGFQTEAWPALAPTASLAAATMAQRVFFHQHWLKELYWKAPDEATGALCIERHVAMLKALKAFGASVCWTLHNLIDHDANALQQALCEHALRQMAETADRIYVHTHGSIAALSALCGRDWAAKCSVLEHSLYTDLATVTPELPCEWPAQAEGRRIVLFLGMIRPYKGVPDLLNAFAQVAAEDIGRDLHLVVAGRMMDPAVPEALAKLPPRMAARITSIARVLSDAEVVALTRRADLCVAPYRNILISGSYYLNTTFSKPTLAPRRGMFGDVIEHGRNGLLYDGSFDHLVRTLREAAAMPRDALADLGQHAADAHASSTVDAVSRRFFASLEGLAAPA